MTHKTHDGFSAKIIADSVSPQGVRLTTAELVFPRFILSEFNTHRVISKNSASSRAIPVKKQLEKLLSKPYIPERIGVNQSGMQASNYLAGRQLTIAQQGVYRKRDRSIVGALEDLVGMEYVHRAFGENALSRIMVSGFNDNEDLQIVRDIIDYYSATIARMRNENDFSAPEDFLNIHKQTLNRYLEPFMWHTVVATGTEWDNMFALRIHEDAQDEIRIPVDLLREAMSESAPKALEIGEWHLPFIQPDEAAAAASDPEKWQYVSVGRCARTSYETHDGVRDPDKDVFLAKERLLPHGHMSPFEHVASPAEDANSWSGNFRGWTQFRKGLPNEDNYANKLSSLQS